MSEALRRDVRRALAEAADAADAGPMQAYMKSTLPFYGVRKKARQAALKPVFAAHAVEGWAALSDAALGLWREASHREERYAALDLLRLRQHRAHWTPKALPLVDELIVTGAWWDLVDEVATKLLRAVLESDPPKVAKTLRVWAHDEDMWRRRAAIIAQIGRKEASDRELLADAIEPAIPSKEFFLRKAIGWALRELSKTDPDWVRAYVDRNQDRLSGLSRREALKRIGG